MTTLMNILLLEDHPIFRFGVRQLIAQRWPDATVIEAETLALALKAIRDTPPTLAIIDLTEIGLLMHLSPKTVTSYRARIMEKLGVSTNAELIRYCIEHRLSAELE